MADHAIIHAITTAAFAPVAFSDGTEPGIIAALRAAGELTLSLVAEVQGQVVGHVAFSPVTISSAIIAGHRDGWFALGPIAVAPALQRQGIGGALIAAGLARLRELGARGCVLIGDPGYYGRYGFAGDGRLQNAELDVAFVQWLGFGGQVVPQGQLAFAPAFGS